MPSLVDRRLAAQTVAALALANVRYWTTVAPRVRAELRRWELHARQIADTELRAMALAKLHDERFNAEVAATLATLAPRVQRARVTDAIVALELLYDFLDALSERPSDDPLGEGAQLFAPFLAAVDRSAPSLGGERASLAAGGADGYLAELSSVVRKALAELPAGDAIAVPIQRAASRSAGAQVQMHAVMALGVEQAKDWAESEGKDSALGWREFLAGAASSVLAVHALIAAGADPTTTAADARAIERAYLATGTLITLLDSLVDREQDVRLGLLGFASLYESPELASTLEQTAERAVHDSAALPHGAHHVMTLVGIVAYYTSSPDAESELARPIASSLQARLRPTIAPTLAVMRSWRLAKRSRRRMRPIGVDRPVRG